MQDPSVGVAQPLQNHVHLISGHRFPHLPQLTIEQAFRYLIDAPTIVKQTAPMAWLYLQAPPDGTLWLEWISPRHEFRFPSDGYVWGDPESQQHFSFGGYTIEVLKHSVGFRPGMDHQYATHARTRYHFRDKNPSVNAAQPDTHLWIVHYHQTDQNHMMPIPQLQIAPALRQMLGERKWLEGQGRIEKRDFMLHDREHWPQITVPTSAHMGQPQQQGMYANPMMQQQMNQQRFPQNPYAQGQGPPAKRPRHSGPSGMHGSADGLPDTSIEDEENTSLGDFFDHLSPREISMARYMQHHRWMEEVFSSSYASSNIVPPDLGLGLMGELKGLTEGILDPPTTDESGKVVEKTGSAKEVAPFTNLKKEQVDEFNKRVEKHLEDGRAEIERMKKEHAEKMAEWKKAKTLMQAEKRLRNATWEGHETAVPVYRLDASATSGHAEENAPSETVEDVVKNVESILGVKIESHKESTMVERGGLDEQQPKEEPVQQDTMDMDKEMPNMQRQESSMSGSNNVEAEAQPGYSQQHPLSKEITPQAPESNVVAQHSFSMDGQGGMEGDDMGDEAGDAMGQNELDDMVGMGDDSLMHGMDMDVDDGGMEFIENDDTPLDDGTAGSGVPDVGADYSAAQQEQPIETVPTSLAAVPLQTSHAASPVTLGEAGQQEAPLADQPQAQALPTTTPNIATETAIAQDTSTVLPPESAVAGLGENDPGVEGTVDNSLFDDGTFDDLTNMDGGGGDDGLIDFDGGLGMEDSAFGDAMHGMDADTPLGDGQGGM